MKTFNVKLLYVYKFISQCLPIYAFYTILFVEKGMSVADVAVLVALWSVFAIVFEVPSGMLADRWNRRNMLVLAAVFQGVCFVIWFFSHTFLLFALGFVFWAVAGAFTSGTEEGLIFDNLKSDGCEERFTTVYGRANFFGNLGTIVGIASAGLMASLIRIEVISLISAVICFANAVLSSQIREKNFYSERLEKTSAVFFETFKEAGSFFKGNGVALLCVLFMVFFVSLGSYLDEFDALIINDFQLSHIWVSVILTVRFVFIALGDLLAPVVQKRISSLKQLFLVNALACSLLILFAVLWQPYAIFMFGFCFMLMTVTEVLLMNALQNSIKEEGRATVISFYGIGHNMVMVGFSLVYALLSGLFRLQTVYLIIAVYGLVGGLGFYLLSKVRKIKS